jgi:hypothetical protein
MYYEKDNGQDGHPHHQPLVISRGQSILAFGPEKPLQPVKEILSQRIIGKTCQ